MIMYLLGKFIKLSIIDLLLPGPPLRSGFEWLEAPVGGEGIVQKVETVPGNIHLVHLSTKLYYTRLKKKKQKGIS